MRSKKSTIFAICFVLAYGFVATHIQRAIVIAQQITQLTNQAHPTHEHAHPDVVIEGTGSRPVRRTTWEDSTRAARAGGVSTTPDNQILAELPPEDASAANLFDLNRRTLVFTPDGHGHYSRSVQSVAWEDNIGDTVADGTEVQLQSFMFDFASRRWDSFFVSQHGLISFGEPLTYSYWDAENRHETMSKIARKFVTTPMISPLYKPALGGYGATQHVKHWPDRVVVTWMTTEPHYYVHGVAPEKSARFQVVLAADGSIRFSYVDVFFGDGIVGLFSAEEGTKGELIGSVVDPVDSGLAGHIDLLKAAIYKSNTDTVILEFTTRDSIPTPPTGTVYSYRLYFDTDQPWWHDHNSSDEDFVWAIDVLPGGEYVAWGDGVVGLTQSDAGNQIALLAEIDNFAGLSAMVIAEAAQFDDLVGSIRFERSLPFRVDLPTDTPATDLSQSDLQYTTRQSEVFHYQSIPDLDAIVCRVIDDLGDEFDLFVFHNEFRVDTQESATPWVAYRANIDVDGVGIQGNNVVPCGAVRLKGRWLLPVWMRSNHVFDASPSLTEASRYDRGLLLFAHEFTHNWTAHASYQRDGVREPLFGNYCRCHWRPDLHLPAAFPWHEEAAGPSSLMGGRYWRDNGDGTFTQLLDYWAGGHSWLDLYAMGLAHAGEVPDMFILRNLRPVNQQEPWGPHTGEKEIVSIEQVVAAEGPRTPTPEHAQKVFNAGFVYLLDPGSTPTDSLLRLHRDYIDKVIEHWSHVTGGRSRIATAVPSLGNRSPVTVGMLPDLNMQVHDAEDVDVGRAFRDPDGDPLTYIATSSAPDVVSVSVSKSIVAVRAENAGTAVVTVTATDTDGSNTVATQPFTVTVGGISSRLFVPIVLRSRGRAGSFFTSELTLTNRGSSTAAIQYTYTASFGEGSGTAVDFLESGRQRVIPDAIAYLTSLGVPIESGSAGGTLAVDFSNLTSPSDAAVTVRVNTPVEEGSGRAGLAFPGLNPDGLLDAAALITGLRQNSQDRSNVAVENAGDTSQGDITLRVTVFSGDSATPGRSVALPDRTLAPGGFHQYNGILNRAGFDNGYVKVERVSGTAPYYAYGVINDNFNSDGSFVFPLTESSLVGTSGQTLPVIIETGTFNSELTVTNFSLSDKTIDFSFVADANDTGDDTASFSLRLKAGEQRILPEIVKELRRKEVDGIGRANREFVGALFATPAEGDMSGIVIGARTGSPDKRGGQYSLFYNGVPNGAASIESAWIYGLQQNAENRSNLALVNTGEVDDSSSTFEITIYDGSGETQPRTRSVVLGPRRWTQENGILGNIRQGYVQVRKTSGNNPFVTYGVINDGGRPGERSGDGAFLLSQD